MRITVPQKASFGLGAVGKDMVYALSASYVLYYYQDVLGMSGTLVGVILMVARFFDALNDPFMGVLVARTRTRWGKFRPWLFSGTVLNAVVLYALFSAPDLKGSSLLVYFSVFYILWGLTYTMMDIPFWSMIPAITSSLEDRETLSVVGKTCSCIGAAIIQIGLMLAVAFLGKGDEKAGFRYAALIIACFFVLAEGVCCLMVRERGRSEMKTSRVRVILKTLFSNDQALVVAATLILINTALYITSNLILYFFKYDLGGDAWEKSYSLFASVGGVSQVLGMVFIYPLLRRKWSNEQIFSSALLLAIIGYTVLLGLSFVRIPNQLLVVCIPGIMVFTGNGMTSVITTIFLSGAVDYGEVTTGHREESVIFSMQTLVFKAASGFAVFLSSTWLDMIGLSGSALEEAGALPPPSTLNGLRLFMTLVPILGLAAALAVFRRKFKLTDRYLKQLQCTLEERKAH